MYKKGVILNILVAKTKKQRSYTMTENSLISLYCIVDDFIQMFIETSTGKKNEALYYGKREKDVSA